MIVNFLPSRNKSENEKDLNRQIKKDMERYIKDRVDYQKNHLDTTVKDSTSHHYEEWTKENQSKIEYAQRILDCITLYMDSLPDECGNCGRNLEECQYCIRIDNYANNGNPEYEDLYFRDNDYERDDYED
ncbi:MAG: hypothetical protein K0Q47_47 [Sedimentibacter sp.]|jgi:glutaredoxin|nr:hypothetical protein [Sedimentibacter sp.]